MRPGRCGTTDMGLTEFYQNKRVMITGHTGFKGSWLCVMLHQLGARVSGFSLGLPTEVSMFEKLNLTDLVEHDFRGDITQREQFLEAVEAVKPEIVLHLAAQPIVLQSYRAPLETLHTNVMGTACVLDCIRSISGVRACLVVTTDKCYKNREWIWGYRENEELGGDDPYSCSKACAELVANCYAKSYFAQGPCQIATARAGNVIGGGDWAEHRLIPDIVRSASAGRPVVLRHPESIRPWQHVLEPLYGYLLLCQQLCETGAPFAGAWNFGPAPSQCASVGKIAGKLCSELDCEITCREAPPEHEAARLGLDSTKAGERLGWRPTLSLDQALSLTAAWYRCDADGGNLREKTEEQLAYFWGRVRAEGAV